MMTATKIQYEHADRVRGLSAGGGCGRPDRDHAGPQHPRPGRRRRLPDGGRLPPRLGGGPLSPTGNTAAISSSLNPSPVGPMPWTSSSGPWSVVGGQPSAAVPTGVQAGPQSSLVVQRTDEGNGRGGSLSGLPSDFGLDSALADLVSDADRWRDGVDGATNEVQPLPGAGDAPDGSEPDGIRSDKARPAPVSRPVEVPYLRDGFISRRLRTVPVSDTVLDELAAEAAGWPGRSRPGVPGGPVTRKRCAESWRGWRRP